jgi:hypothetical protein
MPIFMGRVLKCWVRVEVGAVAVFDLIAAGGNAATR